MISQNTNWSGIIRLDENVQVAHGATLSVDPGTKIFGNGYTIQTWGGADFSGSRFDHIEVEDLSLQFGNDFARPGTISINFVQMNSGSLSAPTGNGAYGKFEVQNSSFANLREYSYIWYPEDGSFFSGNYFRGLKISAGTSDRLSFSGNVFSGGELDVWASYGEAVEFSSNTILNPEPNFLEVMYSSAEVSGNNNYFANVPRSEI